MMQERIEFPSRSIMIRGKVFRPEDISQCKGIVIFTHGLGYCERQYKIEGDYFAQNNYLLFVYNLRGHAGTEGHWTLQASVDDLKEIINYLTKTYPFENNGRICLIGHSTGALISLLAAIKDKRIKFASMVTTVTCLTDSYLHWFSSGFNKTVKDFFKSKGVIPPIIERFLNDKTMLEAYRSHLTPEQELKVPHRYGMLKSDDFGNFFHEIAFSPDLIGLAGEISIPTLLFRGEYDEVMDVNKTNEFYEKLIKKNHSKLFITDSKNHFHNDRWRLIQETTLKFFDEYCALQPTAPDSKQKQILVVDDDPLVTRTLKKALESHNLIHVTVANSGEEALEKIQMNCGEHQSYDLVIADIRMPGLDGIETMRRMKEIMGEYVDQTSPVIFITGYEGARTQDEARALGYVDYLHKPIDFQVLLRCVTKQLGL